VVCLAAAFGVFFVSSPRYPNGQFNPAAYPGFAAFVGLAVIAFVIVSALGTQKRMLAITKARPPPPEDGAPSHVGVRFMRALRIANFRRFFLSLLIMYLFAGTQSVLVVHMNTYFWGLTPQQSQFTFYAQILGFVVGLPLAKPLAATFDKKWAYCICVGGACVMMTVPIALRLLGWYPPNGDIMVLVGVAAANLAYGTFGASSGVFSAAMLADIADQYELKHGDRAEGLFFGAVSFSSKASIGMGGALAGLLLDAIHFPRPPSTAVPSHLAVERLGIGYGPVLLLLLFLGLSIMFGYDLTREKHATILQRLKDRRSAEPESAYPH
jgi:Na+/melibiose symporter-like transporter